MNGWVKLAGAQPVATPKCKQGGIMEKPKMLKMPHMKELMALCEGYLEEVKKGESEDTDTRHYIFEAAMEAFYGKAVWEYVNSQT